MRLDNATISEVSTLIRYHDFLFPKDEAGVRRAMNLIGELFDDLMLLMRADNAAKSDSTRDRRIRTIEKIEELHRTITERGDCVDIKHLAITGGDLISAGIKPGPGMGKILGALLDEVLEDPSRNERGYLLRRASELDP